jgi:hypothetical protein
MLDEGFWAEVKLGGEHLIKGLRAGAQSAQRANGYSPSNQSA